MADNENYDIVKADFDEIAELNEPSWNHNNCYFNYLLKFIPRHIGTVLDIGCGKGELSKLLSERAEHVIAVDLSERMIERARELNNRSNIEYVCGNIMDFEAEDNYFDVVITTATAHHLPYEWLLSFAESKLRKNGVLIILDLAESSSLSDYLLWGFAAVPNLLMNIIHNGRIYSEDEHSKELWDKHGKHDTYMTINEIRQLAKKRFENVVIKRKLFWRYVLVWKKTGA